MEQNKYEFEKYIATKETLAETIDKYGVAIIPEILNSEECEKMLSGMWDYFEHITSEWEQPLDRNNTNTWRQIYELYPLHSMLVQHWGVGHAQVSWDIRQNPKIIDIFQHFWFFRGLYHENMKNTENTDKNNELLVSFDGLSFGLPPEVTRRGWHRKTWFHTDQSYLRNDFECLQSWVTALDVEEGDATLSFLEGSNKYHGDFYNSYPFHFRHNEDEKKDEKDKKFKSDWYKLNEEEEKFYTDLGCDHKKIKCPKGSIVFWDSRTVHCGSEPIRGIRVTKNARVEDIQDKIRAVIYLCYMPKNCSEAILRKKRKALEELRTTNHWPCKPKLFPKNPRTYGKEIPKIKTINAPMLTSVGKQLAGF